MILLRGRVHLGAAIMLIESALFLPAQARERHTVELRLENRRLITAEQSVRVKQGDEVEFRGVSDETVELHLHGYDLTLELEEGKPEVIILEATETGRFALTVHHWGDHDHGKGGGGGHDALTYLEVYPR